MDPIRKMTRNCLLKRLKGTIHPLRQPLANALTTRRVTYPKAVIL